VNVRSDCLYCIIIVFTLDCIILGTTYGIPIDSLMVCRLCVSHLRFITVYSSHKVQSIIQHKVTSIVVVGFIYE